MTREWQVFCLSGESLYGKTFLALLIGNMCFWFSTSLFMPVLPLYYHQLGFSEGEIGLAVGAFSVGALAFRFSAGKAIDRYGSKPVLTAGMLLSLVAVACYPLGGTLLTITLFRLLHGIGISGYGAAALTTTSMLFPESKTTEAVSMYALFTMIGTGLATSIALTLYDEKGFMGVVWCGIAVTAASLVLFPKSKASKRTANNAAVAVWPVISRPSVMLPAVNLFIVNFSFSTLMTFLPLFVLLYGGGGIGYFFVAYAVAVVLSRMVVTRVCKLVSSPRLTLYLMIVFGAIMLFMAYWHSPLALALAGVALGIAFGFAFPSMAGFVAQQTTAAERGTAYGFFITGNDLGQVLGAIGMGFFVGTAGYEAVFAAVGWLTLLYCAAYGVVLMPKLIADSQAFAVNRAEEAQ